MMSYNIKRMLFKGRYRISIIFAFSRGRATVRVKGGKSLRNGMWHGLRNDIIMRNVKYGNWRKEIN